MSTDQYSERLNAVRGWLTETGHAALIVPMADEFQTEYVPEHAMRLRWLTGFRGSKAIALISASRAIVQVPPLYELQASMQVDGSVFEIEINRQLQPDLSSLCADLPEGASIACDARLVTPTDARHLEAQVRQAGGQIDWLLISPVDELWRDRPAPPDGPVFVYPENLAGEPSRSKRKRIGETIGEAQADCAVITLSDSVCWLLNVRGHDCPITPFSLSYLIAYADGHAEWFVEPGKIDDEVRLHVGDEVQIYSLDSFWTHLESLGSQRVLIEDASVPYAAMQKLESAGATVVHRPDPCQRPKAAKNAIEVERMLQAHVRDGAALSRYLCWLETQLLAGAAVSEMEGARQLTAFRAEDPNFFMVSFPPISAAGEHAALPHYQADEHTDAALSAERCYLVDSGGQYRDGGTTDVTRTFWLTNPPPRFCDEYTRVLKGYLAIDMQRFRKGACGDAIDTLARQFLWQVGKDYGHGTGHGVGAFLNVHEGPQRISSRVAPVPLEVGNILSNEPGYYRAGEYGIRIENLVLVEDRTEPGDDFDTLGFVPITLVPIDTRPILPSLLTQAEADYLNAYHARVLAETGPLVDTQTRHWLEARCAPI